jgi:hypothetical protein
MGNPRRFALLSLAVGLFSLRASLTNRPNGQLGSCPEVIKTGVTWNPDLTLDFYKCSTAYDDNAGTIFLTVTVCGVVLTLYGGFVLVGSSFVGA